MNKAWKVLAKMDGGTLIENQSDRAPGGSIERAAGPCRIAATPPGGVCAAGSLPPCVTPFMISGLSEGRR